MVVREEFEKEIKRRDLHTGLLPQEPKELGNSLEFSCRQWAQVAATVHSKLSKKKTKGPAKYRPSAEHRALQVHYKYLDLLLKICCGFSGKRRAGPKSAIKQRWTQLHKKLSKWQAEEEKVWKHRDDRPACLDFGTGHPREWWLTCGHHEEPELTLPHDMKILQRQMKGALSREQTAEFKQFELRRKQDIAANKMKYIIQSTLGTRNPNPVFNQIETPDGWLTDPHQIHRYVTDGWAARFVQPRSTGVALAGLEPRIEPDDEEFLPAAAKWEQLLIRGCLCEYVSTS